MSYSVEVNPTVSISINKNTLKHYNQEECKTVYLKDETEFMIQLFNPLSEIILCRIKMNGKDISFSGITLYPGQRIFLERYLDENKKFKFTTYEVDNLEECNQAIKNNGLIEISFYKEAPTYWYNSPAFAPSLFYYNDNLFHNVCYTNTTGIITKGDESNQSFSQNNSEFSPISFYSEQIRILPITEKVYTKSDLKFKKYCDQCGKKVKSNDKYCSNCGNKI